MHWRVFALIPLTWCAAEIRHVPADYPTIQEALNAVADGDTVLVDLGDYAEALQAPPLEFVLKGNVIPDTGDYPRPVVNPSSLPDPTLLACLTLPAGSHAVIEDFVFRNGSEMFPSRPFWSVGGVQNSSMDAEFCRCIFDSTYYGIYPNPGRLSVTDCEFRRVSRHSINSLTPQTTRILAHGCSFSKVPGSGGSCIAIFSDSSLVEDCWFKEYEGTSLIQLHGRGVVVRRCLFGSAPSFTNEAINGFSLAGCRLENNLFKDMQVQMAVGNLTCVEAEGDTCFIRGNTFLRNTASASSGGGGLILHGMGPPETVIVENNVFDSCAGGDLYDALELNDSLGAIAIYHNRFMKGTETSAYAVSAGNFTGVMKDNLFYQTGKAVTTLGNTDAVDARWNWWSDPTGPYHSELNPAGLGDTVVGNLLLDPWHVDTLFFESTPDQLPPLPERFTLSAYPNPFNSTVTLTLVPSQVAIVKVELFDILGRCVQEIWSGPLAYEKTISFDGSHLASGIYFVRVWQPIGNRPLALQKLVLLK